MSKERILNNFAHIRPIGDKVFILPEPKQEKTIGGIIIPEDGQKRPRFGLVVAAGAKCDELEAGDRVCYGDFSGLTHDDILGMDGEKYELLSMHEVEIRCAII